MRKIIEATPIDKQDIKNEKDAKKERSVKALAGLATISVLDNSIKRRSRQKLMNDIMYYLRKLVNLAKQVQNLNEGVESDTEIEKSINDFEKIKQEIDDIERYLDSRD